MAQAFGLEPQGREQFNLEIQTKSYFIRDLFTEVIIPDKRLVRPNSRAAKSKRLFNMGIAAASVVALAVLILGMSQAYFRSKAADRVRRQRRGAVQGLNVPSRQCRGNTLTRLNTLLSRINALQDPPFFMFGMDRSQALARTHAKAVFPATASPSCRPVSCSRCSPGSPTRPARAEMRMKTSRRICC